MSSKTKKSVFILALLLLSLPVWAKLASIGQVIVVENSKPSDETVSYVSQTEESVISDTANVASAIPDELALSKLAISKAGEVDIGSDTFLSDSREDVSVTDTALLKTTTESIASAPVNETPEVYLSVEPGPMPEPTLALAGAQILTYTVAYLTAVGGDVVVKNVRIERVGLAPDVVFSAVGIFNNGSTVGIARALRGDHTYDTQVSFVIKKGETHQINLFGSMVFDLSAYDGLMPQLSLARIDTDVPVKGGLPITGVAHTINSSLAIGTLTVEHSQYDPGRQRSYYVLETGVFSGLRLTAGSQEPIQLTVVNWRQNGSASIDDITNVETVVVTKEREYVFDTPLTDPNLRFYTANMGDGVFIGKGESVDVYVRARLGRHSDRTVIFDVDDFPDLMGIGLNYNNFILGLGGDTDGVPAEGQLSTLSHPFYHGYSHTISAGSFGVER